jgi:hypothetical protein
MEIEKKDVLIKQRELVKPNHSSAREIQDVESLCEGFTCGEFYGNPDGDINQDTDILF